MTSKFTQASFLKFAATAVAAPRLLGWALISVGYVPAGNVLDYLHLFEAAAGIALAILEAWAISFVFAKWRLMKKSTFDFWSLTVVLGLMVLTFIFVSSPYLYFMQTAPVSVSAMFSPLGQPWSTVVQLLWCVASISASILVVVAVGIADYDELEAERKQFSFELEKSELETKSERSKVSKQVDIERIRAAGAIEIERIKQQHRLELKRVSSETTQRQSEIAKPFVCPFCEKGFDSQNGLNGHVGHCQAKVNGKQQQVERVVI